MSTRVHAVPRSVPAWPPLAIVTGVLAGGLVAMAGPLAVFLIGGLVIVAAVGAVAWRWPRRLIGVAIAATPLAMATASVGGAFNLTVSKLLFCAAAAGWAAGRIAAGETLVPRTRIAIPLLGLLGCVAIGIVTGVNPGGAVKQTILWTSFGLCALAVAEDRDREDVNWIVWGLALAGAGAAIAAILTGGAGPQVAADGGNYVTGRISGAFGQPNTLAAYLALALPVQLVLASRHNGARRAALLAMAAVCVVALVLTLSRGAFVGMAIAGVMLLWHPATRRLLGACAAGLVIIALVAPGPVSRAVDVPNLIQRVQSISSPEGESASLRTTVIRTAPHMVRSRPVFGFGAQSFPRVSASFGLIGPSFNGEFGNPHNIYIDLALSYGLLGLAAAFALGAAATQSLRRAIHRGDEETRALATAIGALLAGQAVIGLFHDSLPGDTVTGPVIILIGAAAALGVRAERTGRARPEAA